MSRGIADSGSNYPESAKMTPAVRDMLFENIDEQAACLTDYDQKYQQMSRGKYQGQFRTVLLDDQVELYFETFNQTLDQWGASPSDRYAFIFFMDPKNYGHLGSQSFTGETVLFLPPGHSFDFRCMPQTSFCVVSIDHVAFEQLVHDSFKIGAALSKIREKRVIIQDQACLGLVRQVIAFIVHRVRFQHSRNFLESTLQGAKRSLCELLAGLVVHPETALLSRPQEIQSSDGLAHAIRDYIRDRRGVRIGPNELAQKFSISRRNLERIFQSKLGYSPAAYIQIVRLNEFRSALLRPENQDVTIGDVAANLGIWHLSRLAQNYRQQFGELPSDSRAPLIT